MLLHKLKCECALLECLHASKPGHEADAIGKLKNRVRNEILKHESVEKRPQKGNHNNEPQNQDKTEKRTTRLSVT